MIGKAFLLFGKYGPFGNQIVQFLSIVRIIA